MPRLRARHRAALRRATHSANTPTSNTGELNIVPFLDIVVNLMLFLFATIGAVAAVAQVEAQLPEEGSPCRNCRQALDLSVRITGQGFWVAGSGGVLGPDCGGPRPGSVGPTIASEGPLPFNALSACLATIKAAHPEETEVIVSADPTIPLEILIATLDASKEHEGTSLFPKVRLAAGIR
ncbi:MAG: biopolymer transporter ExbD [Myxococcota bacterium]